MSAGVTPVGLTQPAGNSFSANTWRIVLPGNGVVPTAIAATALIANIGNIRP
jgi:hypothetical protein